MTQFDKFEDAMRGLFDDTRAALSELRVCAEEINMIARAVDYLHPEMAKELGMIAASVRGAADRIRDNQSETINQEYQQGQAQMGSILSAFAKSLSA